MARREAGEINAGSMADIAFLLLVFFLVTTTMDVDAGISRKLSEKPPKDFVPPILKEKNVFEVNINRNNDLLVEDDFTTLDQLRQKAIDFIDNGGSIGKPGPDGEAGLPCDYCHGAKDPKSSDHPNKAIISVQSDRGTSYGMYISVQNELLGAYTELRNRYANDKFGMSFTEMEKIYKGDRKNTELKKKIDEVKEAYPQIISDVEQN
ncbi:MAG: ExbD/TolR family protein [Flavobacteriaceae bacterium]